MPRKTSSKYSRQQQSAGSSYYEEEGRRRGLLVMYYDTYEVSTMEGTLASKRCLLFVAAAGCFAGGALCGVVRVHENLYCVSKVSILVFHVGLCRSTVYRSVFESICYRY